MTNKKQCVGVDISQETFASCICTGHQDGSLVFSEVRTFKNGKTGYNQLLRWVRKTCDKNMELVFLMEATGVYYENLAYHLFGLDCCVHVVLPNTSKHFFSSLNIKSKTDEIDARVLSRFGVERKHNRWQAPSTLLLELRNLTRYYVQLQEQKTAIGNIKHSKEAAHEVQTFILKSNQKLILEIDKQLKACVTKIKDLVASDELLKTKVEKLQTIDGVGILTIATIIAETFGFELFHNAKQLVSYAGYDVVQRESGTSVKGKTRISKKGNRYIRNALYFPGMVACRHNQVMKETYLRIITHKPSKMVGQVAIQRKLLVLIYTLWKNNSEFIEGYEKIAPAINTEATQDSTVR